jgi:REP element-mobilizing transposase RayT
MTIPLVVGYFKMNTAKRINQLRGTPGRRVWQRDYYERVIRNERHLYAVRRYIRDNPACWPQVCHGQTEA